MPRMNLKKAVTAMEVNDSIRVRMADFAEITARNYAATIGGQLGRRYTVKKGERAYTITRTA